MFAGVNCHFQFRSIEGNDSVAVAGGVAFSREFFFQNVRGRHVIGAAQGERVGTKGKDDILGSFFYGGTEHGIGNLTAHRVMSVDKSQLEFRFRGAKTLWRRSIFTAGV